MIVYQPWKTTNWKTLEVSRHTTEELLEELYDISGVKLHKKMWWHFESRRGFLNRLAAQFKQNKVYLQQNGITL